MKKQVDFTKNSKLGKLNQTQGPAPQEPLPAEPALKTLAVKIDSKVIDKLNDYVFWAPKNQSEVVEQILSEYLEGKKILPIPEQIKEQQERAKQKRRAGMKSKKRV